RRGIAAAALARLVKTPLALARIVECPEHAVVLVGELDGGAGRAGLRAAADEDRQLGALQAGGAPQPVVLAVEADALPAEEPVHDLELLAEARDTLAGRCVIEPVCLVLALHPAGAHPEHDASAGDLVGSRRVPREQRGMSE